MLVLIIIILLLLLVLLLFSRLNIILSVAVMSLYVCYIGVLWLIILPDVDAYFLIDFVQIVLVVIVGAAAVIKL